MADSAKRFLSVDLRETHETLQNARAMPWADFTEVEGARLVATPYDWTGGHAVVPHDFDATLAGLREALTAEKVGSCVTAAAARSAAVANVRTLPALYLQRGALPALLAAVQDSMGTMLPGLVPTTWIEARLRVEAINGRVLLFTYGGGPKGLAQMIAGAVEHFVIALETQAGRTT